LLFHNRKALEGQTMNTSIKTMMLGIGACAFAAPAFAYTLSGTIPPHAPPKSVVLHPHIPLPPLVRLTMSAPPVNAGVPYALTYCIGPAANPCGLPNDWAVEVSAGQSVVRTVPASLFAGKVFVVGQGTKKSVPYKVQIDPGL
jgi:hypothetical protein